MRARAAALVGWSLLSGYGCASVAYRGSTDASVRDAALPDSGTPLAVDVGSGETRIPDVIDAAPEATVDAVVDAPSPPCGTTQCAANELCVERLPTAEYSCIQPHHGCPPGWEAQGACCVWLPRYQCVPVPSVCSGAVDCTCGGSLCGSPGGSNCLAHVGLLQCWVIPG